MRHKLCRSFHPWCPGVKTRCLFTLVMNKHAPLKVKCIDTPQVPYMHSDLCKEMHNRNMWRGKHFRNKKDKYSRSMYVKWRNKVVRLRQISIQNYFDRNAIQNIIRGISTKRPVRFYQKSLQLAMIKSSSMMMGISNPIPHKLPIYLICIIRLRIWRHSRWAWLSYLWGCCIETCHDDVIKWKHFPRYWPFVRGIHRSTVNSPHKGQWRGALMFSLICAWINGWLNNGGAGNLRRHRAHYDVTVMHHMKA